MHIEPYKWRNQVAHEEDCEDVPDQVILARPEHLKQKEQKWEQGGIEKIPETVFIQFYRNLASQSVPTLPVSHLLDRNIVQTVD